MITANNVDRMRGPFVHGGRREDGSQGVVANCHLGKALKGTLRVGDWEAEQATSFIEFARTVIFLPWMV